MATAQEKVLENIDKVAMANYAPYEKVLAKVKTQYTASDSTLSAGFTYDGLKTIPNPLGYKALPVAFVQWIYNGATGEWFAEDDVRRIIRQVPLGFGFSQQVTVTVTDADINIYYSESSTVYPSIFNVYIYLMEI